MERQEYLRWFLEQLWIYYSIFNGSPWKSVLSIPSSSISYQITLIYMCPFPPRPYRDRWGVACAKDWVSRLLHAFTPTLKEKKPIKHEGSQFCETLTQTPSQTYCWRDEFLLYLVQLGNLLHIFFWFLHINKWFSGWDFSIKSGFPHLQPRLAGSTAVSLAASCASVDLGVENQWRKSCTAQTPTAQAAISNLECVCVFLIVCWTSA